MGFYIHTNSILVAPRNKDRGLALLVLNFEATRSCQQSGSYPHPNVT